MKKYKRITPTERIRIEALYNIGHTYREIAHELRRSVSSIYAEVQHGLYDHLNGATWEYIRRYSADIGQNYADKQATSKGAPIKLGHRYAYARYVAQEIHHGKSPDAITGQLRKQGAWTVCTATLYSYISNGYIPDVTNADLWEKSTYKKRPYQKVKRAVRAPKGSSIEQRPPCINDRLIPGHWEMDTVIGKAKGKGQVLLVLTERLTRYEIIVHLRNKKTKSVVRSLDKIFLQYPQKTFRSITVDNGSEFQDWHGMEYDRKGNKRTTIFYCHPFSSCERGSNENANKIIRRFYPKGKSLARITKRDTDRVMEYSNNLPRRILGYATPEELFQKFLGGLATAYF